MQSYLWRFFKDENETACLQDTQVASFSAKISQKYVTEITQLPGDLWKQIDIAKFFLKTVLFDFMYNFGTR